MDMRPGLFIRKPANPIPQIREKFRHQKTPGVDVDNINPTLGFSSPGRMETRGFPDCDENKASRERIFKKHHQHSCKTIDLPENHRDS